MANGFVNLPNNLYSGGTFVYNPAPFTNFYLNQLNRKRAKDEALNTYYQNFTKSINPAGMRTQDIENGWQQKVNDWKNFYFQNADKIKDTRADGGKAYNEFMSRYQDILNDTQRSKAAAQNQAQVFPILSDPDKRTRLADGTLIAIHNSGRSIYDQNYQPLDPSSINYNPKETTANDVKGYIDLFTQGIKMSPSGTKVVVDPTTKNKQINTVMSYKPSDLAMIANRAETLYGRNHDFKNFVDSFANETDYNDLNKTFKNTYGHDLDIKHPEELAAAWALKNIQLQTEAEQNKNYSPTTIKINMGDQIAPSLDNYISQLQQSAKQNPRTFILKGQKQPTMYEAPKSAELSNAFAAKVGTQTIYPDQVLITSDNNFLPIFYKYDNGKAVIGKDGRAVVDQTLTHPVDMQEGKLRIAKELFGEKGALTAMKNQINVNPEKPTQNSGYTNITETNKGTIGVKNGKWYDIKTGKPIE